MGWGSPFASAWNAATDAAKSAANSAAQKAKSAYDYTADKVIKSYEYAKDEAALGKRKAVQGYDYAKDKAIVGLNVAKQKAVQGFDHAKANAAKVYQHAKGAAGMAVQGVARVGIEARHLQALGPFGTANYAYGKARAALGLNRAGSAVHPCPALKAKCANLKEALAKAEIADDTYNDSAGESGSKVGGYQRLDPKRDADELKRLVISNPQELLEPKSSDFRAYIYKRVKGGKTEYVIGYRGTKPTEKLLDNAKKGANWRDNFDQGIGHGTDDGGSAYNRAMRLALRVSRNARKQGASVSYTGHSLGGGLASAAAVITGNAATTYNAAGLHPNTVGGSFPKDAGPVEAIFSPSDPLSFAQDNSPLRNAYGKRHVVPFPDGEKLQGPLDTHAMRLVKKGIQQEQKDAGCGP